MTIMPAWIREQDDKGVWALLGSEPSKDSQDEFIPKEKILNIVIHPDGPNIDGRRFAMIVLRD